MVANPMQKKARNSFLLGMIITFIICIIMGGMIFFLMSSRNKKQEAEEGVLTYAYSLIKDVKSGEEITSSMVQSVLVTEKAVPKGAFASKVNTGTNGKETWVDKAFPTGYKSKVNLKAGTILSNDLLYEGEKLANDLRYVEYNMLVLSTTVNIGDYIDIRMTFSNGQDLIVVSKKEVKTMIGDTIGLELTEEEILMMNSAIVEAYIMPTSKLYAIQYVEPGIQEAAIKTYTPTTEVQGLMGRNPNITEEARAALFNRFNSDIRIWINNGVNQYETDVRSTNITEGLQKEIENAKAAREAYLSGLTSY